MTDQRNSHTLRTMKSIILRQENQVDDYRFLGAEINSNGDLLIKGQDIGSGVESVFGFREYEWCWTIQAVNIAKFEQAITGDGEILELLEKHFSQEKAAGLQQFLQKHENPFESWSRVGD